MPQLTTPATQIQDSEAAKHCIQVLVINRIHVLNIDGEPATDQEYARIMLARPTRYNEAEVKRDQTLYAPRPFKIER